MTDQKKMISPPEICPVFRALSIVKDRWTILILRDFLRMGPRRFQHLATNLKGISPNTLSARLKEMEEKGLIERRLYEEHPPRAEYILTERGKSLSPVMKALYTWGEKNTPAPKKSTAKK